MTLNKHLSNRDTQHNNRTTLSTECHYAVCHLCRVSFMLCVIYAVCHLCCVSFMLSVAMLRVIMLNVIMLTVIMLNVVAPIS